MLRNLRRGFALVLVSAWGCNDVTLELLPKPPPAQAAGKAGGLNEQAGEGPVGGGGAAAGRGSAGSGLGGFGNFGNDGGDGNPGAFGGCGPTGCFPVGCAPLEGDCKLCKDDRDCDGEKPYCEPYVHHCVACRTPQDCPDGESCENDCPPSAAHCDPYTNTCREPCIDHDTPHYEVCAPFEVCDRFRAVCVECNESMDCKYSSKGSVCYQRLQVCVECYVDRVDGYSPACRDPSRPICHVNDLTCHPCSSAAECGAPPWRCEDGRCIGSQP